MTTKEANAESYHRAKKRKTEYLARKAAREAQATLLQDIVVGQLPHTLAALPISRRHSSLRPDDVDDDEHLLTGKPGSPKGVRGAHRPATIAVDPSSSDGNHSVVIDIPTLIKPVRPRRIHLTDTAEKPVLSGRSRSKWFP
jgi:hypothetical protein